MSSSTTLLPFQPLAMSPAQLAAVSYLARYSDRTHALYALQLRRWFSWCERNGLERVVVGENQTFYGAEGLLRWSGVEVVVLDSAECRSMMEAFIAENPALWNEDIGEPG